MKPEDLKIGGRYNWKNQPERLVFIGTHKDHFKCRGWFQFAKVEEPTKVWSEVRAEDLVSFEETKAGHESEDADESPSDTPSTTLTDADCTRIYHEANNITTKNPPITTERIFKAMRAAYELKEKP